MRHFLLATEHASVALRDSLTALPVHTPMQLILHKV